MKKITLLFLILPFLGLSQIQIGQDIDGENSGDGSGESISLSADGTVVAIGSVFNNDNGTRSGHVRIYENINNVWTQIGQDLDGDAPEDKFGFKVRLSSDGSIVAISAPYYNDEAGLVRIYENVSNVWTQIGNDILGGPDDFLGEGMSLSADGSIVAIGVTADDTVGNNAGKVAIYENINGSWILDENITGTQPGIRAGSTVSLSENGDIVAFYTTRNINGQIFTGVEVFQNINNSWSPVGDFIAGMESGDFSFGYSISLSSVGSIVAIGSPFNDENSSGSDFGNVRVYENINNVWTQVGSNIIGEGPYDRCGWSLDLSSDGTLIAIGAIGNNGNGIDSGHIRIYKNIAGNWVTLGQGIDIDGEFSNDDFGFSTQLSSDGSIVSGSSRSNSNNNGTGSGHTRVFNIELELAVLEVVEDIAGNTNGTNVTADQLNSIDDVSGAIEGVNYTTALDNGTFVDENNPTASEIQFIIDQVNASLSIEDNELFSYKLYPNPAKTEFTIQLDSSVELEKVSIYNTLGQLVLTSEEKTVNTSTLSSGFYVVEIETNKGKSTKQLILK